MSTLESFYKDGTYLAENLDWHRQDSSWKASKVIELLTNHQIVPYSICEVGCGAGDILVHLAKGLRDTKMAGFDISPQAAEFWKEHQDVNAGGGGD